MENAQSLLDRVSGEIVFRTGIEQFLDNSLILELKKNRETYNILVSDGEYINISFSFYDGEKVLTLEYPCRLEGNKFDTDSLQAFAAICCKEINGSKYSLPNIYQSLKTDISKFLESKGVKVVQL